MPLGFSSPFDKSDDNHASVDATSRHAPRFTNKLQSNGIGGLLDTDTTLTKAQSQTHTHTMGHDDDDLETEGRPPYLHVRFENPKQTAQRQLLMCNLGHDCWWNWWLNGRHAHAFS